jgi:S-adenosylmethionine:tRNA ribosyltransferase-isomerase
MKPSEIKIVIELYPHSHTLNSMLIHGSMETGYSKEDMLLSSYDFNLPANLIADRPIPGRENSKLLVYRESDGSVEHRNYYDLPDILSPDQHLVLNQSKVFPCRLVGQKATGGKCEVFILSLVEQNNLYPALVKTRGKKMVGDQFQFGDLEVEIKDIVGDGSFLVSFNQTHYDLLQILESVGEIPIPPYIRDGIADEKDKTDYQTVYAKDVGSVAAPTAGLHFTESIFKRLEQKNISKSFVTLHVGAGTFKPVVTENILEHSMHAEYFDIDKKDLQAIRSNQKKLIAVGTTSLRVLESLSDEEGYIREPKDNECTDIFLYPGKKVNSINGLITNFHLPKSTLLMLVSTLIGRKKALELYNIAIENEYRFFSYGDGMIILRD